MGTRSLTVIKDEQDKEIVVMYRQFDGYLSGHGAELKEFLLPYTIVNGIGSQTPKVAANGMGCLAAQLITHFKSENMLGGFYLYPAGTRECGEEFIYEVSGQSGQPLRLKVSAGYEKNMDVLFDGPITDFIAKDQRE